jgi:hypothetical protein|tara:strand:- start:1529 stop:1651 length:123 start_codon:yes stop_codon:yes gene_type:complete
MESNVVRRIYHLRPPLSARPRAIEGGGGGVVVEDVEGEPL